MVKIIKEELSFEESLKKKIEFICDFCNTTPKFINGTNVYEQFKEKDNEISFLKSKISSLRNTIDYWKDRFDKLISFLHSKLHNWYDKDDKYFDVVNDMYEDNVLDDDDIKDLKLSKEKDDFER